MIDPFGEFEDEPDDSAFDSAAEELFKKRRRTNRVRKSRRNALNNIPKLPPLSEEVIALREKYAKDYLALHREVFTQSTGLKPFGPMQERSIKMTQRILDSGGKGVKAEPRGYAKTSRTTNEALAAVLQGKIRFPVILASSATKAEDILESMKTELVENEVLYKLYPGICECFRSLEENNAKARYQTYDGHPTHIDFSRKMLSFPIIPGEVSSGSVIQVRPKDNVRGIAHRPSEGPYKGRVLRPDFIFFDDIQTDEEANNPNTVKKIVTTIKKSVLRAGTHSKGLSAIMCCTPIALNDVSCHFLFEEMAWERIMYSMLESMPTNMDWWLGEYRDIRLNFDRDTPGASLQAALDACELYRENREIADEGAKATWEWAFAWEDETQTEISAIQHAMNIYIDEGVDVFETECQCNVSYLADKQEDRVASIDVIRNKQHHLPRGKVQKASKHIVSHIDIGDNILTYVTMSSADPVEAHIIDYGTYPEQPSRTWAKDKLAITLGSLYPQANLPEQRILLGLKDLINHLGNITYEREDGILLEHSLILADARYLPDIVYQACRESSVSNIAFPSYGQSYKAKDQPLAAKHYQAGSTKHWYCVTTLADKRNELSLSIDVNHYKSTMHRGWLTQINLPGSISLFTDDPLNHDLLARHCNAEYPDDDIDDKSGRSKVIWTQMRHQNNEFMDNIVGCLAGFSKLGLHFDTERVQKQIKALNMEDYMRQAREKDLQE